MGTVYAVLAILGMVLIVLGISYLDQRYSRRENPRPPRPRYKEEDK